MKRFVPIAAALTCVLLVMGFLLFMRASVEYPHSEGERLSIAALDANEEIVVSILFSHRSARGREYRIRSEGPRRILAIFDTTPEWARDDEKEGEALLLARDLSTAEVEGLEETVAYCREVQMERSSATRHMQLRYFRGGKQIGEEFYLGFYLPSHMAWLRRQHMPADELADSLTILARNCGVSMQRLYLMTPFEALDPEEPNPSLQATGANARADLKR